MPLDLSTISDSEIASLCRDPNAILRGDPNVRCLAKLSDEVIVKCGWSVTPEEAANQEFAYNHSLSCELKVPKVLRYFRLSNVGYIVMEFIDGVSLEKIAVREHPGLIQRLALAIRSLFDQMQVDYPGPRNGGIPRGYLFSENGAGVPLNSISKLNQWLNERSVLKKDEPTFNYGISDCVFCHLDLGRRNIIMLSDGSFGLLDWEHAGFYPRAFESYCLQFNGIHDRYFCHELLKALDNLQPKLEHQDQFERQIGMLDRVYRNNLRYGFSPPTDHEKLWNLVKDANPHRFMKGRVPIPRVPPPGS